MAGGGKQTPGFVGHSKRYITSKKFISAEGGIQRIVWMPTSLKEEVRPAFATRAQEQGLGEEFMDQIADERSATSEEEVLAFITQHNHPVLSMDPMF